MSRYRKSGSAPCLRACSVRSVSHIAIRPAEPRDVDRARDTFADLLPDRWREGGNRRSFVAVRIYELPDGEPKPSSVAQIVGHARGIDNAVHPGSRTLVFETVPELHGTEAERDLLRALLATSPLPLHSKPEQKDTALRALLVSMDSVLVQLMPPWRYRVDADLKAWAQSRLDASDGDCLLVPAASQPQEQILALEVEHYIAQHKTWSPTAARADLFEQLADDHDPASEATWDHDHSWAVTTPDGQLKAAALVWGAVKSAETASSGQSAPEVSHLSYPYSSPQAWKNKLRAIAGVIRSVPVGTELCIDSHLSMRDEFAAIETIPGVDSDDGEWCAIVATLPPGAEPLSTLDPTLIPPAAFWAREFTNE